MTIERLPVEVRFWPKVAKGDDCWTWTAARDGRGYGKFGESGRSKRGWTHAHRVSYALTYGEFDPELCVLHKCDNPPCVRPDHLFLGTRKDNAVDMASKGRARAQKITHCAKGHPFSEENTYFSRDGRKRRCKTCVRNRYIASRATREAVVA